ncbi:MAG: LTA synthase family protein [Oscillospiraceae bacterium]|jgi:phosphoglycerol transferase MdoB-like AlkP superfamily enzyme|nr:LTA synthase family protein [Oscillospiraceae bacterium]
MDRKNIAVFSLLSLLSAYMSECIARGTFGPRVGFGAFLLTSLFFACLIWALWIASNRLWIAYSVIFTFMFFLSSASWSKLANRGVALQPADLRHGLSIFGVIGSEQVIISPQMIFFFIIGAAIVEGLVLGRKLFKPNVRGYAKISAAAIFLFLLFLPAYGSGSFVLKFTSTAFEDLRIDAPELLAESDPSLGVSADAPVMVNSDEYLLALLDEIDAQFPAESPPPETPDVIIILSESFWDFSTMPAIRLDGEIAPNFRELAENAVSGNFLSRTYAGGTAGVEYELLTGVIYRYLSGSEFAYEDAVNDPTPTLATLFKERGYDTTVMHSYYSTFYNRDNAMPLLGFDNLIFLEQMDDAPNSGRSVSDEYLSQRMIGILEDSEKPQFLFTISMEAHQPYSADRYPGNTVKILNGGMPDKLKTSAETYIQSINNADAALKTLTDYLSERERPAVVLFFGDHQPNLGPEYGLYRYTGQLKDRENITFSEAKDILAVPYLIWSNYKTDTAQISDFGCSFLGNMLLNYIGGPKPLWYRFLDWTYSNKFHYDNRDLLFIDSDGGEYGKRPAEYSTFAATYRRLELAWLSADGEIYDRLSKSQ